MAAEFFEAGYIGARFAFIGKTWPGIWRVKEVADRLTMGIWPAAWSVAGGLYDGKAFTVGAQNTHPQGLFFKPDGTKFYVAGSTGDAIFQYTCSTPWDLTTASYDNISFAVEAQESDLRGVYFKPDGTKFYIIGPTSDSVFQYTCSTAWDISTASYDGVSFSVNGQDPSSRDLTFKPDGTKFYMVGSSSNSVFQYTCSTPWDISTGSYDSKTYRFDLNRNSSETDPQAFIFNLDGTKCYMTGTSKNTVYQYSCSTSWDVSTITYDGISVPVVDPGFSNVGISFSTEGTSLYVMQNSNNTNSRIKQLSTTLL
jgi:sugar lactone lactonase YvrE